MKKRERKKGEKEMVRMEKREKQIIDDWHGQTQQQQ